MPRGRPPHPDVLTPREWEVLDLLREGLSNDEIAARLGISYNGARYHVAEILSKLGVGSRDEAAAWRPEGARQRRFAGVVAAPVLPKHLSSARLAKVAGVLALGVAATIGVLFAAGVIVTGTHHNEPVAVASTATVEPTPDFSRVMPMGPYVVYPEGTTSPIPTKEIDVGIPPYQYGQPVDSVEGARTSALFPAQLPEGDSVVAATSEGKPSELYLHLTLSTPDGPVEMVRQRPSTMPIDVTYDPAVYEPQLFIAGVSVGSALMPKTGLDLPYVARGFEDGVSTKISGATLNRDSASTLYRAIEGLGGPTTLERLLPTIPDSGTAMSNLTVTGPCEMTVGTRLQYTLDLPGLRGVSSETRISIAGRLMCEDLVALTPCPPGSVYENGILPIACDASGNRIDASWSMPLGGTGFSAGGPAYVQDGVIVIGTSSFVEVNAASGDAIPVELCATVRDQETCASFTYTVP